MKKANIMKQVLFAITLVLTTAALSGCDDEYDMYDTKSVVSANSTSTSQSSEVMESSDPYDGIFGVEDHDTALTGRWRADDGSYLDLWVAGLAETSLDVGKSYFSDAVNKYVDGPKWTGSNGQLIFTTDYCAVYRYKYADDGNSFKLEGKYGSEATYHRAAGTTEDGMIGDWNIQNGAIQYFFVFNADGIGTYKRCLDILGTTTFPISWFADDEYLSINYTYSTAVDYYVSGDTLTLYYSNGSQVFTKVSEHM